MAIRSKTVTLAYEEVDKIIDTLCWGITYYSQTHLKCAGNDCYSCIAIKNRMKVARDFLRLMLEEQSTSYASTD